MKSKVLILANSDSGLYEFRNELVQELLKKNEVVLSIPQGEYFEYFIGLGCKCIATKFDRHGTNPLDDIKLFRFYRLIIKHEQPDIVFSYTIKPNVYGGMACAMQGVPYVANITGLGTAVENGGLMQKLTVFLYRIGLKKAQKVFFQNTSNQEFMLQSRVVSGKYELLPGSGVNTERFSLMEYPNEEKIHFMFISRVMKEKGADQYLEAAEFIRQKYPNTVFHICGNCEQAYEERLKELQERNVIIYHGMVHNIPEMHSISSCTIHPTYYPEGMSNVLLESCSCGRPIITTDRPGCREIVDDGVNGFIVKQRDSQDLIDKIERFLGLSWKERRDMGLNARKKVEKEFNRDIVVQKYMNEVGIVKNDRLQKNY